MTTARSVRAAFGLVALTWFLLVFGSTVRVHGAGLACPDWPLCFGEVVPTIDFKVGLEFGHRVVAGFVSLGFLGMGAWAIRSGVWAASGAFRVRYLLAVAALALQVVLGGLTVWELLAEWTVASHLVTGNTFCALLVALALTLRDAHEPTARPVGPARPRALSWLIVAMIPVQVALGGLVAGTHAGLACGTWPSCNGAGWFPTFEGAVGLQVTHRVVAYLLLAAATANAVVHAKAASSLRTPAMVVAALCWIQATIGVTNVLLRLPAEVTLLHSAGAAALFSSASWMLHELLLARLPVADSVRDLAALRPTPARAT
jgi:cytochrome c oxidase assembly protein subunit 15